MEDCGGPIFVKYGECGEELEKWLIKVYKGPYAVDQSSKELPNEPIKWNQQYVKYTNGLQAAIMRKNKKMIANKYLTALSVDFIIDNRTPRLRFSFSIESGM